MISPNFHKEKILFLVFFLVNKNLCDIYYLSLFISVRAFLPSLRVLKTSQESEEVITIVSIIKEINVELGIKSI